MGKHRNWALGSTPRTTTETDGIFGIKVTERIPKLPFWAGYGWERPHQAIEQMRQIQMLDLLSSIPRCMQHQIYSDFEISCGAPRSKGARILLPMPGSHGSPYVDGAQER